VTVNNRKYRCRKRYSRRGCRKSEKLEIFKRFRKTEVIPSHNPSPTPVCGNREMKAEPPFTPASSKKQQWLHLPRGILPDDDRTGMHPGCGPLITGRQPGGSRSSPTVRGRWGLGEGIGWVNRWFKTWRGVNGPC
jgi:hypothetical protein